MNLVDLIEYEEGFRTRPYLCTEGYVTIGFGTKLYDKLGANAADFPISVNRKIATEWLHSEIALKDLRLSKSSVSDTYQALSPDMQAIVVSMAYQMGVTGLLNFKRMWKALDEGYYGTAAVEMLDSRWARQTPERAARHARVMAGEPLADVYIN